MHPPPEREIVGDADLDLPVVRDGIDTGDLVLRTPPDEGLVALQPHQRFRPVHPGPEEHGDGRRVARAGEVQQRGFGGGRGVVVLLVPAVTLALPAGPDDLPVLVTPGGTVRLPLVSAREASCSTRRSSCLEDGYKGAEAGDHVGGVLVGLQDDRHDESRLLSCSGLQLAGAYQIQSVD